MNLKFVFANRSPKSTVRGRAGIALLATLVAVGGAGACGDRRPARVGHGRGGEQFIAVHRVHGAALSAEFVMRWLKSSLRAAAAHSAACFRIRLSCRVRPGIQGQATGFRLAPE
jgi:hypothetical protein